MERIGMLQERTEHSGPLPPGAESAGHGGDGLDRRDSLKEEETMICMHRARCLVSPLLSAILALSLVASCDSGKPAPEALPDSKAGDARGSSAAAETEEAIKGGEIPLLKRNPVNLSVTLDVNKIKSLFRPPQPQRDFPVAAASYSLIASGLKYDQVKLHVSSWGLEAVLLEEGKVQGTSVSFWYAYNKNRPTDRKVPFEVLGYRDGKTTLLFRGSVAPDE